MTFSNFFSYPQATDLQNQIHKSECILPDGAMSKVFVEILWEEWMSSAIIMDGEKRSKKPKLGGVLYLVPVLENHQNVMD